MSINNIYKITINLIPFIRGIYISAYYYMLRNNITFGKYTRIKSHFERIFYPGCHFSSGRNFIVSKDVTIKVAKEACLKIGDNVGVGNRCHIVCHKNIEIGEGSILAPNVLIYDHNHRFDATCGVYQREFDDGEVIVGKHCWIGAGCIILKDVHIGDNTIIGAGSVVTKNIPARCIAVGSPAKVIKQL